MPLLDDDELFDDLPVDHHSCRLLGPTALVCHLLGERSCASNLNGVLWLVDCAGSYGAASHIVAGAQTASRVTDATLANMVRLVCIASHPLLKVRFRS